MCCNVVVRHVTIRISTTLRAELINSWLYPVVITGSLDWVELPGQRAEPAAIGGDQLMSLTQLESSPIVEGLSCPNS